MKKEVKEIVVSRILEACEKEQTLPWTKGLLNNIYPMNPATKTKYKGFNKLLLSFFGSKTKEFLTMKQVNSMGGKVNKGAKGLPVTYWSMYNATQKRAALPEDKKEDEIIPILRYYTVFDITDTTIESKREIIQRNHERKEDIEEFVEKFFKATNLKLNTEHCGTASYRPSEHSIRISDISFYEKRDEYYSTLFHEMIHSTQKAMNRKTGGGFGSTNYSKEEIVAETGAMFLCSYFGIEKETGKNSEAYLQGWFSHLKKKPEELIHGANAAEKAVDYMLKITEFEKE